MFDYNNDDTLRIVFKEYNKRICEKLPSEDKLKNITFSRRFSKNAERIINHYKKFYYVFISTLPKRIACLIIMLIILLTTVACSIKPLRDAFFQFVVNTYETFTEIVFSEKDIIDQENSTFSSKNITYIPKGFTLISNIETESFKKQIYTNDINETIVFTQSFKDAANIKINTEDVEYKKITIFNNTEALIYQNKDEKRMVFIIEQYMISIRISSNYIDDELVKIANSIE